jgi:predicted RNA-binding Zn ribbon-like protein
MAAPKRNMNKKKNADNLKLLGGWLCLDFVNTIEWWGKNGPVEYLKTYNDLIAWERHAGVLTYQEASLLAQKAFESQSEADRVLNRGIKLRENIYRIFCAIIAGDKVPAEALVLFNKNLATTMQSAQILQGQGQFRWDVSGDKSRLDWLLNPIIYSASDLLVSEALKKVKICCNPFCGWLFLDSSRNQSRRWCDIKACGNRAKATRFYNKKQRRCSQ